MVLRNVAKTFSLEEQRQEINEIAVDLDAVNTTLANWNAGDWDTAYSWGDHAQAGYLTSYTETDPVFGASEAASITATDTSNWNSAYGWGDHGSAGYWVEDSVKISNWDTAYGWGNHANVGYLTSYTETDPVFGASAASGIAAGDITNWNTAYGWGDHGSAGYAASGDIPTPGGTYSGTGTSEDPIIESIQLNAGSGNFGGDTALVWNTTYNHLIVNGPSNSKDYTLSGGIFVQPGAGKSGLTITSSTATDNAYINFSGGTASSAEQFAFAIGRDGTNGTGMVKIADTTVAEFDSDGIKMASTKGIKFSPYGSGNILDFYQEGTFIPSLEFGGSDLNAVYAGREGYYTRIGNTVFVTIILSTTTKSTATGAATVVGLPFPAASTNLKGYTALATTDVANITYSQMFGARIVSSSSSISLLHNNGNGLTDVAFTNNSQMIISGTYLVD